MYNITNHRHLNLTFEDWISIDVPINEIIIASSVDHHDKKYNKMPDDGWINEPIGMSNFLSFELIYHIMNYVKNKDNLNKTTVYSAFRQGNDRNRRGDQTINRANILKTLSRNNINNQCRGGKEYLETIAHSKFVISPEGNGIDCHRTWEALYLKAIPVCEDNPLTRSKMKGLPVLFTKDYNEITPEYLESIYPTFLSKKYNFNKLFLNNYPNEIVDTMKRRADFWHKLKIKCSWKPLSIHKLPKFNNIYNDLSLITITNTGYKRLTDNTLESFNKLGLSLKPKIYCMDESCREYYNTKSYTTELLDIDFPHSCEYSTKYWSLVTMQKLVGIYEELLKGTPYIFMFDGDIIFKDIQAICHIYDVILNDLEIDLISQREYHGENKNLELNTGYLLIRNNDKTKNFFNPNNYIGKYKNDQNYVNHMKSKLNIHVLENDKFPNGKYFYENLPKTPYIIHFNFVKGHQKESKMKNFNCWYLDV